MLKQGLIGSLILVACALTVGTAFPSDALETVEITDVGGYRLVYCVPTIDSAEELTSYIGRCDERLAGIAADARTEAVATLRATGRVEDLEALIPPSMEVICAYGTDPNGAGEVALAVEELNAGMADSLRIAGFRIQGTGAELRTLRGAATVLAIDPGAAESFRIPGRVVVEGTLFDEMRAFGTTSGLGDTRIGNTGRTRVSLKSGNPFRTRISLAVEASQAGQLTLRLFDPAGKLAGEVQREIHGVGVDRVDWEPGDLSRGVYWLVVGFGRQEVTRLKLTNLK